MRYVPPTVARDVRCPTCKAPPGAPCVTTRAYRAAVGDRIHGAHPARVRVSAARRGERIFAPSFDPPRVTPVGTLRDLLAFVCVRGGR